MFADLHLHTHFSDGTFSPEEVARRAKEKGFSAIALTDHDTIDGALRTREFATSTGARVEVAGFKKDPADFVLWKPSSDDEPSWGGEGYDQPTTTFTEAPPGEEGGAGYVSPKDLQKQEIKEQV